MNILLPRNGPPSLDYHYKKNGDETFGWWGFRNGDTTRNNNKPLPWLDVTSVWHLFDSNVRIVEWFSLLIIKTALDRNRRVVTTNTCVFSLTGPIISLSLSLSLSLPTHSKPENRALLVWKNVGSNATHNITTIITGSDVIHSCTLHITSCTLNL